MCNLQQAPVRQKISTSTFAFRLGQVARTSRSDSVILWQRSTIFGESPTDLGPTRAIHRQRERVELNFELCSMIDGPVQNGRVRAASSRFSRLDRRPCLLFNCLLLPQGATEQPQNNKNTSHQATAKRQHRYSVFHSYLSSSDARTFRWKDTKQMEMRSRSVNSASPGVFGSVVWAVTSRPDM